jgi:hypothetical protein
VFGSLGALAALVDLSPIPLLLTDGNILSLLSGFGKLMWKRLDTERSKKLFVLLVREIGRSVCKTWFMSRLRCARKKFVEVGNFLSLARIQFM